MQRTISAMVGKGSVNHNSRKFKAANVDAERSHLNIEYCNEKKRLPNIAGFCVYCDINRDTFYAQNDYYSDTFKKINDILEDEALNNKYTSDTLKIFYMKNKCGYKDKQEQEIKETGRYNIINDLPKGETNE